MYKVNDASGNTIAIATRVEDAEALCSTSFESQVTDEIKTWIESNLEPEKIKSLQKKELIKLYWQSRLENEPNTGWEIVEV